MVSKLRSSGVIVRLRLVGKRAAGARLRLPFVDTTFTSSSRLPRKS